MPLPLFDSGTTTILTAARLNAIVDKLNAIETLGTFPTPFFQGVILDGTENAGGNSGASRSWRYAILHHINNNTLYYSYELLAPGGTPKAEMRINEGTTLNTDYFNLTEVLGINSGSVNIAPLNLPVNTIYIVRMYFERGSSEAFKMRWLFERSY